MVDLGNLYGGYLKAGRYSGIKDADLSRALKPYGLKLATIRAKRYSDQSMRRIAVASVLKRRGYRPKT